MVDKYGTGQDPYTNKGSDVLQNNLGITKEADLAEAERNISEIAAMDIEFQDPPYNFEYWRDLHKQLFHDIYSWAGELRTIDISKGNTRFCSCNRIEAEANKIFKNLELENYFVDLSREQLVAKLAEYYCDINVIHPFRDGNGRSQRLLFEHLIINCGYEISFENVDIEEWTEANIEGYHCLYKKMEAIFDKSLGK